MKNMNDKNMIIVYDCQTKSFFYPEAVSKQLAGTFDTRPIWQIFKEDEVTTVSAAEQIRAKLDELMTAGTPQAYFTEYYIKNADETESRYRVGFICPIPGELISITFSQMAVGDFADCHKAHASKYDELTGLLNREAFSKAVAKIIKNNKDKVAAGEYALIYFDIIRFKAINDMFGLMAGDALLKHMADTISHSAKAGDVVCRLDADRFVFFTNHAKEELEPLIEKLLEAITQYDLTFKITCNVGIYVTNEECLSVESMIDRAVLALSSIKGSYTSKYNFYTESLRKDMLSEQEISGVMATALEEKQFVLYYQPQYNHSTGMLVGAEALVRWIHPERGMVSPGIFIPIFEKNGFITKLDLYVFEQVCVFIRGCLDKGLPLVPVSSNFSRYDIFQPDFVDKLEEIRKRYDVPTKFLRVEITESAVVGDSSQVNEIINQLHACGYIVEMDDFGSGYSSLNVLKDIELDIVKLDMKFLSQKSDSRRGGIILTSVVRMLKWLGMPVIAEGVETLEQADFLKSIGCEYIQGYFYSRPLPEEQYLEVFSKSTLGAKVPQMDIIETMNSYNFWDPKSQETLIFSNYVGGAAIFEYCNGQVEILRVNKKYLEEYHMNLSEKDLIEGNPMNYLDEINKNVYLKMIACAIESGDEEECETWRNVSSACCGEEQICIRSNVRMIGRSDDHYLFYAMIRNITAEKHHYMEMLNNEKRFKMASEQVNIYYWEYDVATKEMRPCFRCMRDLGLPALLTNYPDSAIEMGIFPPEVADMYRDWHVQIANGVKELEAVMPLTVGRVPFRVKYTTEFDEGGNPVKAYGSAALVVE